MSNFIKFYHFIISSLIIFIMIGFVSNTALTQRNVGLGERMKNAFLFPFRVVSIPIGGAISLAGGATRELKSLLSSTPITTKEEFEAILNDADKSIDHRNRAIEATENRIEALEKQLIPIAEEIKEVCPPGNVTHVRGGRSGSGMFCVHREEGPRPGDLLYASAGLSEEQLERYNKARNEQIAIERNLREHRVVLDALSSGIEGIDDRVAGEIPQVHAEVTNAQAIQDATIDALRLQVKVSDLDASLGNIDQVLDQVERIYDRTVLGAYMQDKIGQLLNSQVICAARKRCAVGDPRKIPPSQIRDELFPSTQTRRSYYDHERLRKIRDGVQ